MPRLSEPGATHSSVAAELGVTPTQLKTWRLELEAAGSAAATAAQKAEAAELVQLRRDNKRLTEEVEVSTQSLGLFRSMGGEDMKTKHAFHRRPCFRARHPVHVPGPGGG